MSASAITIRVKPPGIAGLRRDLRALDADLPRRMAKTLVDVGQPVATDARGRASRYGSAVSNKIRPRVKGASLYVESRARSKGKRPDFGRLVMQTALLPAAIEGQDEVLKGFARMIDEAAGDFGFS